MSAASGLARAGEHLYVVADDENHLAVFPAEGDAPGGLARIFAGVLPMEREARKRNKPDVECVARLPAFEKHPHGALLTLGSCSRRNRCSGVVMGLDAAGAIAGPPAILDLSPLHHAFDDVLGRLNLEGVVALRDELVLLHRGNKGNRRNFRIRFALPPALETFAVKARLDTEWLVGIEEIEIGAIGDVPLCFTDGAALPDGRIAFTAVAEDTGDSYDDGACRGAAVGILGADGRVDFIAPIDPRYKVEGIEVDARGRALLVTDADDAEVPATLLSCELPA